MSYNPVKALNRHGLINMPLVEAGFFLTIVMALGHSG